MRLRSRFEVGVALTAALLLALGGCSSDTGGGGDKDTGVVADAARDVSLQPDGVQQPDGPTPDTMKPAIDAKAPDQSADLGASTPVDSGASNGDLGPVPALGKVTLLVNLGDSIAAGQGVPQSYADLLLKNDDKTYPSFAGKDLATKYPGLKVADLAYGGATSVGLVNQAAKAPANPQGNTLVVVSIGGNDIMNNFMALLNPAQTQAVAQTVSANIQQALANFKDKQRYPGKVFIVALNVYEMTDGQGTMPADEPLDIFCGSLRLIGQTFGKTLIQNHGLYNAALEAEYAKAGVYVVDVRQAFLGHGFNYKDPKNPYYDPQDPTLWLQYDCIHPNVAGHHAIRRLVWERLFG